MLLSRFKIAGHSMEPKLKNGQSVLISSIPYLLVEPRVGDVVVFTEEKSKTLFLKRIKKRDGVRFFIAGDNENDSFDSRKFGWVERSSILGKMLLSL